MAAEENFEALGQESGQKRQAARTEERFPIEFQPISEAEFRSLEKSFRERRTAEREEAAGGGGGDDASDQFSLMGATQVQVKMFQQTMRAIRALDQKLDEVMAALGGKGEAVSKRMRKAMCVDLSAGGMRMISGYKLAIGDYVKLLLPLPPAHPVVVSALGRIVKSAEVKLASGKAACEVAIFFDAIHEEDREEIVSYSFKRQREEAFRSVDAGGDGEGEEEEES